VVLAVIFVSAGLSFGEALERDATLAIMKEGGTVLGGVRHAFGALDFSSPILQAATSTAKVIGLVSAGLDLIASIK